MLAKPYRLPSNEKFENAQSIATDFFRILIKPNAYSYNRFGFVISKKIDKRAVVRNRLRRVLSEAVKDVTLAEKGKDILFFVKTSFIHEPTTTVVDLIQTTIKKVL